MLENIKKSIQEKIYINTAIFYGTTLNLPKIGEDFDIAIILNNDNKIDVQDFVELIKLRRELSEITVHDVDLIPHTLDEIKDYTSPLYSPRYNPLLVYGQIR